MTRLLTLVGAAALLAGCREPSFEAATSAPPGTIASYSEDRSNDQRAIAVSQGVALGVACKDDEHNPCALDGTVVEDGEVAAWYKGFSADLETRYAMNTATGTKKEQRAVFFVVGKKPGLTKIVVRTGRGDVPIDVQVFGAPR